MRFFGQKSISTNRDGTTANGRAKAFLTTVVWALRSENAFLAVILGSKDVFETFLGPIKAGKMNAKAMVGVKIRYRPIGMGPPPMEGQKHS